MIAQADVINKSFEFGWEIGMLMSVLAFFGGLTYLIVQKVYIPGRLRAEARDDRIAERQIKFVDNIERLVEEQARGINQLCAGITLIEGTLSDQKDQLHELNRIHKEEPTADNKFETVRLRLAATTVLKGMQETLAKDQPELQVSLQRAIDQLA